MPTATNPSGRAPAVHWQRSTKRWTDAAPVQTEDTVVVSSHLHRLTGLDPDTGAEKWQADTGKYLDQTTAVGDTVLVRSQSSKSSWSNTDRSELLVHHSQDGRALWSSSLDGGPWLSPEGNLFLSDADGRFGRRHLHTGELIWNHSQRVAGAPHFCGDGDLLVSAQTEDYRTLLQRLDGESGQVRWTLEAGDWIERLEVGQDFALVGSAKQSVKETQLSLINLESGQRVRDFDAQSLLEARFSSGRLYTVSRDEPGCGYSAIDPASGETIWSRRDLPLGAFMKNNLKLTESSLLLASFKSGDNGYHGHALRALNVDDGSDRWSFEPGNAQYLSIMAAQDGTVLVHGSKTEGFGDLLFALDEESGELLWTLDPQSSVYEVYPGPDGKLLVQTEEDGYRFHLLDRRSGESFWQFNTGERLAPTVSDEGLLVSDHEGNIFKLGWEAGAVFAGGPPRDPGESRGGTSFYAGYQLLNAGRGQRQALWIDHNDNGKVEAGRDSLVICDRDGDGRITRNEMANLPSWSEIAALDSDGDGLVAESEWQGHGLFLWRDSSKDGLMSGREISFVGSSLGHYTVFDTQRTRIEYAGQERFQNGHFPELRPPVYQQELPTPDILPPNYEERLRGELQTALPGLAGDRSSSVDGSRWLANRHPLGLDVYVELKAWGGSSRQQLEFRVDDQNATLKVHDLDGATDQTLELSPADSNAERFFFAYPDRWEGEYLYRGGGMVVQPDEGGLQLKVHGSDRYQRRPDGGLDQVGSGGLSVYTFDRLKETRVPGAQPSPDLGEVNFEEDFIDVNGVMVPIR